MLPAQPLTVPLPARHLVMTGAAHGVGAATLARLRARGVTVHVLDVAPPLADSGTHYYPCDLGDPHAIDAAAGALPQTLHGLINVAGVAAAEPPERTVAINFLGLRALTEALLPRIVAGGSVVNVASTAGRRWAEQADDVNALLDSAGYAEGLAWLHGNADAWQHEPYRFSKLCAAAYTYRATRLALAGGVRVNCVNPGVVDTRLSGDFRELVGPALYDWGVAQVGRSGTPDDIAEVLEYLSIGDCRWLNGVELVVDGGYIAGLIGGWINPDEAATGTISPG